MCFRFDKIFAVLNSESHASILVDVGENAVLVVVGKVGHRSVENSAVFQQVVTCIDKFLFLSCYIMHDSDERHWQTVFSILQHRDIEVDVCHLFTFTVSFQITSYEKFCLVIQPHLHIFYFLQYVFEIRIGEEECKCLLIVSLFILAL